MLTFVAVVATARALWRPLSHSRIRLTALAAVAALAAGLTLSATGPAAAISVGTAPAITNVDHTTFQVGVFDSFFIDSVGTPGPTLTGTGTLPAGVTLVTHVNNGVKLLSGTALAGTGGIYSITFTASNGVPPDAVQVFTLTVDEAPTISSASSATFQVGVPGSFTVTTSGFPAPSLTKSGTLPSGLSFVDNGDGTATISGTPTSAGVHSLQITAANGVSPDAKQTFKLTTLSADASLAGLSLSHGTLTPSFSSGTVSYAASVANSVSSLTVTPTTTDSNATVKVNGVAVTSGSPSGAIALSVGANTITTVVTAQDGTTTKTYTVTVTRAALPSVTGVSPSSGPAIGGTNVTISGANFTGATAVKFGTASATNVHVVSANSITATAPAGTGVVDVTVTTPNGTSPINQPADEFTYNSAPSVTAVSPNTGPPIGGTSVTISGAHFSGATAVRFGGTDATAFTVDNATTITATAPAGSGTVDVTVTTPNGTSATSSADAFTYDATADTVSMIGQFLETRGQIILSNGPDIARRIDRLNGVSPGGGGVAMFGMPTLATGLPFSVAVSGNSASFAYSLSRSRQIAVLNAFANDFGGKKAQKNADGRGGTGNLLAYGPMQTPGQALSEPATQPKPYQPFDIWAEGKAGGFTGGSGKGHFGIVNAGADYLFNRNLLVGLGVQLDDTQENLNSGSIGGIGYLVGPYATVRLGNHLYADARAGWGQSFNHVSPYGTYKDNFNGNRWLATAALVGSVSRGHWTLSPAARASIFDETSSSYTDSNGGTIPSVHVQMGTVSFGATLSYAAAFGAGTYMPYVTAKGIWTFQATDSARSIASIPETPGRGIRLRLEGGVNIATTRAASLSVSGFYDGIGGTGFTDWGGKLSFNRRF